MIVVAVHVANTNVFGQIGVISGVGKGIIASSTGLLLKTIGLNVTSIVRFRDCYLVFCFHLTAICYFYLPLLLYFLPFARLNETYMKHKLTIDV